MALWAQIHTPSSFSNIFLFLSGPLNAMLFYFTTPKARSQTVLSWCILHSVVQSILRAACWTLSAVTVNRLAAEKWSLNFRETWHPHSHTIKQKYCCHRWPSSNRPQWPAVHFPNWTEDINVGLYTTHPKPPFFRAHTRQKLPLLDTHALTHTLLWSYKVLSTFVYVCQEEH